MNDELGHETGDAVIVACARCVDANARAAYDELIRLGGDEFVVVAPVPDVLDALRLADDVREQIAAAVQRAAAGRMGSDGDDRCRDLPRRGADPESLLRAADVALYRAKDCGPRRRDGGRAAVADCRRERRRAPKSLAGSGARE